MSDDSDDSCDDMLICVTYVHEISCLSTGILVAKRQSQIRLDVDIKEWGIRGHLSST
jgi:hypothetical protein